MIQSFTTFAQSTGTPGSGGSNAEDFQPPTRNPQTAPTNLQPGTVPQTASGQDILNNSNARIIVPVQSGEPSFSAVQPGPGGINWPIVVITTLVIVVVAEYVLRRREKQRVASAGYVTNDPEPYQIDTTTQTITTPEPVQPKTTAKKKRKSKSKRKR